MNKNIDKVKVAAIGDREIVMTREFNAPRTLVFDAFTKPELVKRWLIGPDGWVMSVCEIDLKVGGAYRYEWSKQSTGENMGMGGEYREIAPGEKVVATEKFDMAWYPGSATVTTTFSGQSSVTMVTTTILYDTKEARETVLRSPMATGIEASYQRLEELFATSVA
ncbi:MAG: SRPBCC family protein [Edaphobacter sp.]|uniref:SRPBCC family protein n=1 Tax=Edaphobacter sp. TaxID=1934404 RepID=UPI0023A1297B|nr:SRPBCC family protein [Edaphobacter sp.]MDE1178104.1 SRPBCC family protein [Edaphobacter sp.]